MFKANFALTLKSLGNLLACLYPYWFIYAYHVTRGQSPRRRKWGWEGGGGREKVDELCVFLVC